MRIHIRFLGGALEGIVNQDQAPLGFESGTISSGSKTLQYKIHLKCIDRF